MGKIKDWIFGKVILGKVVGKFAKHGAGVIVALLAGPKIAPILTSLGISLDAGTLEAGLVVFLTGAFGAAWNFIEHRLKK